MSNNSSILSMGLGVSGSGFEVPMISVLGQFGVGIKKSNPNAMLDVNGNTIVSGSLVTTGNVGIGKSTPTTPLEVVGIISGSSDIRVRGNADIDGGLIDLGSSGGNRTSYINSSTALATNWLEIARTTNHPIIFSTGTTTAERMRISGTTGNIIMGGAVSPNNLSGRGNLTINGNSQAILNLNNNDNATEGGYMWFDGTNIEIKSSRASSAVKIIAGTLGVILNNNGTTWGSLSDERIKDIIEPITDGISKVSSLRSVIGKYKSDKPNTRRAFLIAQDVQKVLPEAVVAQNDKIGTLTLAYTDVIPLLVSAIQEQQTQIEELKLQVTTLLSGSIN
jgi:hypothetical protein